MKDAGISNSDSMSADLAGNPSCDDHYQEVPRDLATSQTDQECKDPGADNPLKVYSDNAEAPIITSDIPPPKRYAHHGKRRRRFTEELFRCQFVDKISRSDLVCNALLWKNRPDELRAHLKEHLSVAKIEEMNDDEVKNWYSQAKRIFLEGIPEDLEDLEGDNEDNEQEED